MLPLVSVWLAICVSGDCANAASQLGPRMQEKIHTAIVYESIIDQTRDIGEVANLIAELGTDYVHRGFFRWRGMAEIEQRYPVYEMLKKSIAAVREKNRSVLFGGAVAAQEINTVEYDPLTAQVIPAAETWQMAFDPQQYGFEITKQQLHDRYWQQTYDRRYIFPDLANPAYNQLLLDFIKKQIDCGVDVIWIDGLFAQAGIVARLAHSRQGPVIESRLRVITKLVDEIHQYGQSLGKRIYVGSWAQTEYPYPAPELDFVTLSPSVEEIRNSRLDEERWLARREAVAAKYGDVPLTAFIDWAFTTSTPLGVFSQELNKEQACRVLEDFDRFFSRQQIIFAYPVHGGFLGREAHRRAFGRLSKYDSLAPEFDTYRVIKELAAARK